MDTQPINLTVSKDDQVSDAVAAENHNAFNEFEIALKIATDAEERAHERLREANLQVGDAMNEEERLNDQFKLLWHAANINANPYEFVDYDDDEDDEFFKLSDSLDSEEVKLAKVAKKLADAAKQNVADAKENASKLMSEAQNLVKTRVAAAKALAAHRAEEQAKKD